jgi:hypothetical protein
MHKELLLYFKISRLIRSRKLAGLVKWRSRRHKLVWRDAKKQTIVSVGRGVRLDLSLNTPLHYTQFCELRPVYVPTDFHFRSAQCVVSRWAEPTGNNMTGRLTD